MELHQVPVKVSVVTDPQYGLILKGGCNFVSGTILGAYLCAYKGWLLLIAHRHDAGKPRLWLLKDGDIAEASDALKLHDVSKLNSELFDWLWNYSE